MELKLLKLYLVRLNLTTLLIEPYGIEMPIVDSNAMEVKTFNRTLWN